MLTYLALDSCIIVNKRLMKNLGLNQATFIASLYSKVIDNNEWISASVKEIQDLTTLSKYQQQSIIDDLQNKDIIEVDQRGFPCSRYIKINETILEKYINGELKVDCIQEIETNQKISTDVLDVQSTLVDKKVNDQSTNFQSTTCTHARYNNIYNNIYNNQNLNNINNNNSFINKTIRDKSLLLEDPVESENSNQPNHALLETDSKNIYSVYTKNKENTSVAEKKSRSKEVKDTTKSAKIIASYIYNETDFSDDIKKELINWYYDVSVGRISLKFLKLKLEDLKAQTNNNQQVILESIKKAHINGWFNFYPKSNSFNNFNTITSTSMSNNIPQNIYEKASESF